MKQRRTWTAEEKQAILQEGEKESALSHPKPYRIPCLLLDTLLLAPVK
jgi:hypothetical protein